MKRFLHAALRGLLRSDAFLRLLLTASLAAAPAAAQPELPDTTHRSTSAAVSTHEVEEATGYHLFEDVQVALNLGTFGALQTEQVFELGLEARLAPFEFLDALTLRPIIGASLLDDGGNYWYLGARTDLFLDESRSTSIGLSFAPGIYSAGGIDLGGPVEFRSGIDLNFEILDGLTAGAGLFHLSNGGLYSRNRGSESLLFTVASAL